MTDSKTSSATTSPVKRALVEIRRLRQELADVRTNASEPLAVIGFAHRLPGVDPVPDALHDALMGRLDAISEVPADRWDADALFDPSRETPGRMYTKRGGFLEDVRGFDPEFFGISPFEASSIDPQQRLLLEVAWEALEHAAIDPTELRGSRTGVFVGIASNDYGRRSLLDHPNAYASVGSASSVAAGRVAYLLDLRGPALSVDTACSSSLAAAHLASRSLRSGESDLALVGGVNLILAPEVTVDFCQAGMLATDGRCKTFDADADGYVRSEGCGVIVLKRLSEAQRDGDRVLATIRGSAINQDGRSSGLTAPNGPAQEAVVRSALEDAGLGPDDVDYVEAHGTGTSLGDPIEAQALGAVFATGTRERPVLLGSVKTNLGHLEAAAGVAGLIKAVEVLRHGYAPPHLHFHTPNPHIEWDQLPLDVTSEAVPLPTGAEPRRAGVSSFGFSGTNAHVVLEAAPELEPHPRGVSLTADKVPSERSRHLLTLSAHTEKALRLLAERYVHHLRRTTDAFPDICFTANVGRAHLAHRLALIAADAEAAAEALSAWLERGESEGLWTGRSSARDGSSVAFLFSDSEKGDDADVTDASLDQAELWRSWGVEPDVVAGVGRGHLVAARVAGALRAEDMRQILREGPESALSRTTIRPPTVPILSGVDGTLLTRGHLADSRFWDRALTGSSSGLRDAFAREDVTHVVDVEPGDLPSALETLASLHVQGLDPDWRAFEGGRIRRKVSLPTTPFVRRPFWLEETEPSTPAGGPTPWEAARSAAVERSGLSPVDVTVSSYASKWEALAAFSQAIGRNALISLGAFSGTERRATLDSVMARTGIKAMYRPIVGRWLKGIELAGVLEAQGPEWRWEDPPARIDIEPIRARVQDVLSDDAPLRRYILHASSLVEGVLRGEESPLSTLFPEGSFEMASDLYEGAGQLRYVNGIAADALEGWVAARPPGAPVRVLEIGAGTGGTTSSLIPRLPAHRSSYEYTDVSDIFLDWGARKFADTPFLRTSRFDVELDPRSQGIEPGSHDVVVGSNVIHAVRDLRATLRRVRSLLAPGGLLILVESTGHLPWHDITTGMIEGWQRFEDELRADGPLLEAGIWLDLFSDAGFHDAAAFPPEGSPASVLRQHVLLGRVSGEDSATGRSMVVATPAREARPSHETADVGDGDSEFERRLAGAVGSERDDVAVDAVRECVMEILRSDPDRPPSQDARLMELGVDSLMAVRLGKLLKTRLGLSESLPSTLIFDYPTIRRIAGLIRSRIEGSSDGAPTPARDTPDRTPDREREREVAELSDEEAEARLLKRLESEDSR